MNQEASSLCLSVLRVIEVAQPLRMALPLETQEQQTDVAAGQLVQPFPQVGWDGHGYYLAYPEARRNSPKIRAFRDWILGEFAKGG